MPLDNPLAFHVNETTERYTPPALTKKVKLLLNSDTLDVASCQTANNLHRFPRFFSVEDRAEDLPWNAGSVFLNPPGNMRLWWDRLIERYEADQFEDAIFIAFTLSIFAQRHETMSRFPHWVPRQRIKYWSWLIECSACGKLNLTKDSRCKKCAAEIGSIPPKLRETKSPPHYSAIIYLPPKSSWTTKVAKFGEFFCDTNPAVIGSKLQTKQVRSVSRD
jgi:hypothetical protein